MKTQKILAKVIFLPICLTLFLSFNSQVFAIGYGPGGSSGSDGSRPTYPNNPPTSNPQINVRYNASETIIYQKNNYPEVAFMTIRGYNIAEPTDIKIDMVNCGAYGDLKVQFVDLTYFGARLTDLHHMHTYPAPIYDCSQWHGFYYALGYRGAVSVTDR